MECDDHKILKEVEGHLRFIRNVLGLIAILIFVGVVALLLKI